MNEVFPERRRRTRIITLKNVAVAVVALGLLLAAFNVLSELRAPKDREYGRIYGRQMQKDQSLAARAPEIIPEAPVADQTSANPMILSSAAREQILGVTTLPPATPQPMTSASSIDTFGTASPVRPHGRVAIVGDGKGVAIVTQTTRDEDKLRGGIFKQQ
jgi:hypothetical protein